MKPQDQAIDVLNLALCTADALIALMMVHGYEGFEDNERDVKESCLFMLAEHVTEAKQAMDAYIDEQLAQKADINAGKFPTDTPHAHA